jgi:hypothetical protein
MCRSVRHSPPPPILTTTSSGRDAFGSGTASNCGGCPYPCTRIAFIGALLRVQKVLAGLPVMRAGVREARMQNMWCAGGEDACQQAGLPAHRKSSNKSSRRHRAATAAANPVAPKERQADDPQTVGLQADYLLDLDPDRGRSPALGRMPVCLLPAVRALELIQPPWHRNTSISSWRRCVSAVGSESWRQQNTILQGGAQVPRIAVGTG